MPVEVLLALFPDANPSGPITRFYIDYCINHMPPGQWPRFNGFKDLSDGTRWWDFNPLHIFSDPEGSVWAAGQEDEELSAQTMPRPSVQGDLALDTGSDRVPMRDFAVKDSAIAHDLHRRRAVTISETTLWSSPGGETVRIMPAGTQLTVLGEAEDGVVPVVIRGGRQEQGYVQAEELADATDDIEVEADLATISQHMKPGKHKTQGHKTKGHKTQKHKTQGHKTQPLGKETPPPGPSPAPVGGNANAGARIAAEAERYIGYPFVFATHGPNSFDCSGLVHWVILQATGENVSPDSHTQFTLGTPVEWDQLRPGDIVFYDPQHGGEVREGNNASHVGIFVRDGQMVNALNEDLDVRVSDPFSDYFRPLYLGARRLV
jgi:cell wall-associated NlpC family hydrolase